MTHVARTISLSIAVLFTKIPEEFLAIHDSCFPNGGYLREGRVHQIVPEFVDEGIGQVNPMFGGRRQPTSQL